MPTQREIYDGLTALIREDVPGFTTKWKSVSWANVFFAAVLWPFNPWFLTGYVTTIYPVVYWPEANYADQAGSWQILAHEYVHLYDAHKARVRFSLGYLFPQVLGLFSVLALGAIWWIWALFALLFLVAFLPWPAPWRVRAEQRGYAMSMAVEWWTTGAVHYDSPKVLAPQFNRGSYYWMSWAKDATVESRLQAQVDAVKSGKILEGSENEPFRRV
jgi:hypothetical protein